MGREAFPVNVPEMKQSRRFLPRSLPSRTPFPLQGLVDPRTPCESSWSLGKRLPMTVPEPISYAHETVNQVSSAVDRTQLTQETNPTLKRPHWPGLTNYTCCIIFRPSLCWYPRKGVLCLVERTTTFSSSDGGGNLGSLLQTILQGHYHSMVRVMSKSPSHDLIFIPIDLICRPDHIIQKVTQSLDTARSGRKSIKPWPASSTSSM
jgi:hypothetical protein